MALSKVSVTVNYSKPGTQPPVYIAGSFSDPPWQPHEMEYTADEANEHEFHREIKVEEGVKYQYKFRLGPGDWWVVNEDSPIVTDESGNRNNLLEAPISQKKVVEPPTAHQPVIQSKPDEVPVPSLVVEKVDAEPQHGDDFGSNATVGQKDAHEKRSQDAKPDLVIINGDTNSKEYADTAAEVADSARFIDREPTPLPISDKEAGRIGFRRMSSTPIPEVAKTAAEVADTAALLDQEPVEAELPNSSTPAEVDDGTVTPIHERAPLFAHEIVTPYEGEKQESSHEPIEDSADPPATEEVIDENDPMIEEFPEDRLSILARVRTTESRLGEDETIFEGVPSSPVAGNSRNTDGEEPPSSVRLDAQPSPQLDKITEEEHEHEEHFELPAASNEDAKAVGLEGVASVPADSSETDGPAILIHPATIDATKQVHDTHAEHPIVNGMDSAKSTSVETKSLNGNGKVKARPSAPSERPLSAGSVRSPASDKGSKNVLEVIWRTVFVGWIGGLITRICGPGRRPLIAVSALLLVIAPAWYFSSRVG